MFMIFVNIVWSLLNLLPILPLDGGQLLGLHLAAGLQLGGTETYPLVFQPFGGFGDDDKIEDGRVYLPDAPGLGVELKSELYNKILKPLVDG